MIAEMQENMLDAEIHKLDNLDGKDLAKIREERVKQLKERKFGGGRVVAPRPRAPHAAHGDEGVLRCVEELQTLSLPLHAADESPLRGLERSFS